MVVVATDDLARIRALEAGRCDRQNGERQNNPAKVGATKPRPADHRAPLTTKAAPSRAGTRATEGEPPVFARSPR